jgi:hypothetical protein
MKMAKASNNSQRFIDAMNEDAANLGCAAPDEAPKATEYIDQMQNMINTLVDKGAAYPAANGDVYFEVTKFDKYGRFLVVNWMICKQVLQNVLMLKLTRNIPLTLYFGNMPKKMNLLGLHLGAMVAQVGILNVLQCRLAA